MKVLKGNIWKYKDRGYIVIPTNGFVKKNGEAVMGAGLAKQSKEKFPDLPKRLGEHIEGQGNVIKVFNEYGLITFPVKTNWWENANLDLIWKSALTLAKEFDEPYNLGADINIYMPKVGCGNGKLNWKEVEPIIKNQLGHIVTIVDWSKK
ncbi:MAG: ADP-ribose-binding protein [Candidatus Thorarchaeota archaeon]|jgi:hypothetical protein